MMVMVVLANILQVKSIFTDYVTYSSVVQSLSRVQLFVTPWTAARQASLSLTIFWSLPKFMSAESVMPSNHHILCRPLLLLPSIFPSIRVRFTLWTLSTLIAILVIGKWSSESWHDLHKFAQQINGAERKSQGHLTSSHSSIQLGELPLHHPCQALPFCVLGTASWRNCLPNQARLTDADRRDNLMREECCPSMTFKIWPWWCLLMTSERVSGPYLCQNSCWGPRSLT